MFMFLENAEISLQACSKSCTGLVPLWVDLKSNINTDIVFFFATREARRRICMALRRGLKGDSAPIRGKTAPHWRLPSERLDTIHHLMVGMNEL